MPDTSASLTNNGPASASPPIFQDDDYTRALKAGQQKADAATGQLRQSTEETVNKIKSFDDQRQSLQPPPPPEIPKFQPPQPQNPWGEVFGQLALPLAIFGASLTKQPFLNGLNAAAAVNDAYNQGDTQRFNFALQQWQAQVGYAIKLHDYQMDFYKDALDRVKEGKADAMAELEVQLRAMKDESALQAYFTGGPDALIRHLEWRESMTQKLPEALQKAQTASVSFNAGQDYIRQLGHMPGTEGPPEQRQQEVAQYKALTSPSSSSASLGAPLDDETLDYLAKRWKATGQFPPMYRDAESRKQIMERAAHMPSEGSPTADVGTDLATAAGFKADQTSLGNITRIADSAEGYERTALNNMNIVIEKMPKGVATEWGPWLNRWVQEGRINFGDADVPPYATALVTVANEYAKVMSGSTGSQGSTVDSRREAAELLNKTQNTQQVLGVLEVMKRDMANKKASYRAQRAEIEGRISGAVPGAKGSTPATGEYAGPDDVYKAFDAGKITKEQAKEILIDRFGAKPQ